MKNSIHDKQLQQKESALYKCRIVCIGVAVVCLIGLAICLYALDTPNFTWGWFFAYTCLVGLIGNAVLAVVEMGKGKKQAKGKDQTP